MMGMECSPSLLSLSPFLGSKRVPVILANLEVTDTLGIVVLSSIILHGYTFGAVRDSFGIHPEPNGATA
jgi:hypothetical protein